MGWVLAALLWREVMGIKTWSRQAESELEGCVKEASGDDAISRYVMILESGRLWKDDAIRKSLWTMKSRSLKQLVV